MSRVRAGVALATFMSAIAAFATTAGPAPSTAPNTAEPSDSSNELIKAVRTCDWPRNERLDSCQLPLMLCSAVQTTIPTGQSRNTAT